MRFHVLSLFVLAFRFLDGISQEHAVEARELEGDGERRLGLQGDIEVLKKKKWRAQKAYYWGSKIYS